MAAILAIYWPMALGVALILLAVAVILFARRGQRVRLSSDARNNPSATLSRNNASGQAVYTFNRGVGTTLVPLPPALGPATDLTRIKGLGPRVAILLNGVGIVNFTQIAQLTPEQVISVEQHLGHNGGHVVADRWIDQARLLAAGNETAYHSAFSDFVAQGR